ncbi:MAG: hypothetical protein EP336_09545 [Rhodobacteraceae bacterium]|nr:MAG: hypothetical protein EP336_09545 [Paracoccaceae bacterium]
MENFFSMSAGTVAIMILALGDWKSRDENGRGFLGRLESGALTKNDRTFIKLEAWAIGAAVILFMLGL